METSVKAAEVLVPPQPDVEAGNTEGEAAAPPAASKNLDPMEEFSRRLEDIISTHGSADSLLDRQTVMETETEKMKMEPKDDIPVAMETEVCLIMKSLNKLSSPEQKLEDVVRKYAELAALRRCDEKKLCVLQQRLSVLLDERQQMVEDSRSSIAARSKLETLCRELQRHYSVLTEETLQRCREDEEKRTEITSHFQTMLTEIQAQIEQHSSRNDKLCHENSNLTDKLESLMMQCEMREESLEKINKHRDLQHKLTEAKLQQANALLAEAEDKHKREKEYLLVQAAEWKLQAQTLREQGTVMQAQLTLYAQKFDEFQETLAKSNEIYVRFKKEMDNMSDKMKKMEKESNLWKTRFENCNKALTTMIEERNEKGKEYDLFVLKIQKLEKLCRALQDERVILYEKIKEVRQANSNIPSKVLGSSKLDDSPDSEDADKAVLLTPVDLQELQELQKEDPVLTENMSRLKEEQAKLQDFAASLFDTLGDNDEEDKADSEPEEDMVSSAFVQFKTKTEVKEETVSVPVDVKSEAAELVLPEPDKVEEVPKPAMTTPAENTSEVTPTDTKPEEVQTHDKEVQPVKPDEDVQEQPNEAVPTSAPEKVNISPPTDLKQEASEASSVETAEVKPVIPVEAEKVQAEPVQVPEEAAAKSEPAPPSSKNTPKTAASSNPESSKKQTPKKKKKRNNKNAS
ncbi:beta-taxilin-like isoform X2 [Plectropomus leopardus]|uniref:beta-taxilin-like isoform X2 n=1 Tax=Plectropomus leopardus TaxID=160734 RepID=UPI001C4DA36D|nr:beta-taxilin-like isoform X2 [Plectropomus leopardus]